MLEKLFPFSSRNLISASIKNISHFVRLPPLHQPFSLAVSLSSSFFICFLYIFVYLFNQIFHLAQLSSPQGASTQLKVMLDQFGSGRVWKGDKIDSGRFTSTMHCYRTFGGMLRHPFKQFGLIVYHQLRGFTLSALNLIHRLLIGGYDR